MLQYIDSVISRITRTQCLVFAAISVAILLADMLWNAWNRLAGKNSDVHLPLQAKLTFIYAGFILLVTLFIREIGSGGQLAWMPLWSWKMVLRYRSSYLAWQILLNIILFIPLGALMAANPAWRRRMIVLAGFGLSLCVELCQLAFRLGLFEWDDILHNGVGCVLGMLVVRGGKRLWKGCGIGEKGFYVKIRRKKGK